MLFILFLIILLWIVMMVRYYYRQNRSKRLGGPISWQKTWWLGITTLLYFAFPWWVFEHTQLPHSTRYLALSMGSLLLARASFQAIWMFVVKKWIPPMGMAFNLLFSSILCYLTLPYDAPLTGLLLLLWTGLMLTDTAFAWQFFRLVGAQTKGADAIWYADNSPKYRFINQQTLVADIFFTGLWGEICWLIAQS